MHRNLLPALEKTEFRDSRLRCAFSLVELMIVIAVIVILIALLLPAVGMARAKARQAQCASNLAQLLQAWTTASAKTAAGVSASTWSERLAYIEQANGVVICPDALTTEDSASYGMNHRAFRMADQDNGRIVLLDYKETEARVVGHSIEQLNASWPAERAPRHFQQQNVAFLDGHGEGKEPDKIDPRFCVYYVQYWRPARDGMIHLNGCLASGETPVDPYAGGTAGGAAGSSGGAYVSTTSGAVTSGSTAGSTTAGSATSGSTAGSTTSGSVTVGSTSGSTAGSTAGSTTSGSPCDYAVTTVSIGPPAVPAKVEGHTAAQGGTFDFPLTLSNPVAGEVTVNVSTSAYAVAPQTVTFPANTVGPQTVTLTFQGDVIVEPDEVVTVSIDSPQLNGTYCPNITLGTPSAQATIQDDDCVELRKNLIGRWTFNNAGSWYQGETGPNGTPQSANFSHYPNDRFGALEQTASGYNNADRIDVSGSQFNPGTGSFSVSVWFKVPTQAWSKKVTPNAYVPGDQRTHRIISKGQIGQDDAGWMLRYVYNQQSGSYNRFRFRVANTGGVGQHVEKTWDLPINTWVHYVGIIDRDANHLRQWVQGVKQIGPAPPSGAISSGNALGFPRYGEDDTFPGLKGWLDDVRIYSRALKDCEVIALYNAGNGLPKDMNQYNEAGLEP